jgi:hypothetical protein
MARYTEGPVSVQPASSAALYNGHNVVGVPERAAPYAGQRLPRRPAFRHEPLPPLTAVRDPPEDIAQGRAVAPTSPADLVVARPDQPPYLRRVRPDQVLVDAVL